MTGMIDHHNIVEMAMICLDKAIHHELGTLCHNIITAQQQEIQQMKTWLVDWYGISYSPQMKPGDMRMLERLASLSGAEFEIEFIQMMIKHHLKAIKEASQCVDRVFHSELWDLCENIITAQAAEIGQLRTWLYQWYGICRS